MIKSIKAFSLLFLFTTYAHGMKHTITKEKCSFDSQEMLDSEKDPRLLLELPDDILGTIVKYANPDKFRCKGVTTPDLFNTIKLLIQLSWICKKFERLSIPDVIKSTLNLNQETLDDALFNYTTFSKFYQEIGNDSTPFFKLLIAMGANMNTRYKSLSSCIWQIKNAYLIDYFITHHDANINQQDEKGKTPLRCAINLDRPDIARVLLKHNADMYLADNEGKTPTDMALLRDRIECVKALIEHGVNTTISYNRGDNFQLTIAEWAKLRADSCNWRSDKKSADIYNEIYRLVTKEEPSKSWYESGRELLNDTCIIS